MGNRFNPTHLVAITLAILVVAVVLLMLVKIAEKRFIVNGYKNHLLNNKKYIYKTWQKSANRVHAVLPEFPLGTLSETFIQPSLYNQIPKVIEDIPFSTDCSQYYAGTLYVNVRYDLTRSVLVVVLLKARNLPTNERNESVNYYVITNMFPNKHKPCQSTVYRTSSPDFEEESFEFTTPLQSLLLQSLRLSLWSFDRVSHHEVIAETVVHLQDLETYGLSICRDVSLAKALTFVPRESDACGEIFFSLGYLRLAQRLAIVIIKIINLATMDDEPPDPFVEVSLLRKDRRIKLQRTSTKRKDQNPQYNETLTFDVPAEHLHESSLLFCVLSKTTGSYLEEDLGKVLLGADRNGSENFDHWEEMKTGTQPKARWHKLRKRF